VFNDLVYQISIANISLLYIGLALAAGLVVSYASQTYCRQKRFPFLDASLLVWILFAASVIYKSSLYSLSGYACLGGFFGFFIIPIIAFGDLVFSLWRSARQPQKTWGKILTAHVVFKLIPYSIVVIASIRAVSHCTV
jgi:hypothetical protein